MNWYYPTSSLSIALRLKKRPQPHGADPAVTGKQYGMTEELKAEKQMEWVRQMNLARHRQRKS